MTKALTLKIQDQDFIFDYRRVIYWPNHKILLAADLHWGKTTFLQKHGIAVPHEVLDDDLKRLGEVLKEYEVEKLLVLGDLIHHEKALNDVLVQKIASFREAHPCELHLLTGNHDKHTEFPESWKIIQENDLSFDGFYFSHDYSKMISEFQFSGHVHPMIKIKAGHDQIRLPAYVVGEKHCCLPAYSILTGGSEIKLKSSEKAIAVLPDGLELLVKR